MRDDIKAIVDQHRKRSKREIMAEATAREYERQWRLKYDAEIQSQEDAIPYENRKNFIKQFKAGGITLGDAARANGINDISVASRILSKQIKSTYTHIEELE